MWVVDSGAHVGISSRPICPVWVPPSARSTSWMLGDPNSYRAPVGKIS